MMLNIEVSEQSSAGHVNFLHSVIVEDVITSGAAECIQMAIEDSSEVVIAYSPVRPGDDIYVYPAEFYQFQFYAQTVAELLGIRTWNSYRLRFAHQQVHRGEAGEQHRALKGD